MKISELGRVLSIQSVNRTASLRPLGTKVRSPSLSLIMIIKVMMTETALSQAVVVRTKMAEILKTQTVTKTTLVKQAAVWPDMKTKSSAEKSERKRKQKRK